jgi:hypothetical protein
MTGFPPDGQSAPPRYHRDLIDVLEKNLIFPACHSLMMVLRRDAGSPPAGDGRV